MRVDATYLSLTLASPLTNPSASCLLFYPYGPCSPSGTPNYTGDMERGNAVYDSIAVLATPAEWEVGGDLGSAWNLGCPLSATSTPIVLSDSPNPGRLPVSRMDIAFDTAARTGVRLPLGDDAGLLRSRGRRQAQIRQQGDSPIQAASSNLQGFAAGNFGAPILAFLRVT